MVAEPIGSVLHANDAQQRVNQGVAQLSDRVVRAVCHVLAPRLADQHCECTTVLGTVHLRPDCWFCASLAHTSRRWRLSGQHVQSAGAETTKAWAANVHDANICDALHSWYLCRCMYKTNMLFMSLAIAH